MRKRRTEYEGMNYTEFCWAEAQRLADKAIRHYTEDIHTLLYLLLFPVKGGNEKQADLVPNHLTQTIMLKEGAELGWNEHIPRNMTNAELVKWFHDVLRTAPIIPDNIP